MASVEIYKHYGMCDASAAVALNEHLFIVANDEDNLLRVFHAKQSGPPVQEIDVSPWLQLVGPHTEVDWEAAACLNNVIYWISSHGTNKTGEPRPNRRRLLATSVRWHNEQVVLEPLGQAYTNLVDDLIASPQLQNFRFAQAATIPPKKIGGLCIEGLCATPQGKLLLGFRNPIPEEQALVVPIENPTAILHGERAELGTPMLLDLGGQGIRSIEYYESWQSYLIVAGAYDQAEKFRIYEWSGTATVAPRRIKIEDLHGLRPEALVTYPHKKKKVQLLSDDGGREIQGECCKDASVAERYFRSMWIEIPR
jgi:Protein of unknown function (DUF3616)